MSATKGIEGVIDVAAAYILANQETALAQVVALGWTHALDMPPFAAVRMAEPSTDEAQFPVLFAFPTGDEPRPGAGGRAVAQFDRVVWIAVAEHPGTTDSTGQIVLTPADAAMRLAGRYIRAVRDMLKTLHSHPDRPQHWTFGRVVYNQNYTRPSGAWLADAQLQTSIEYTEA